MYHSLRLPARFAACGITLLGVMASARAAEEPAHSAELDAAIIAQAKRHGVPEKLVRRIVMRESRYNPRARNHSFWGLMQISYPTAKSMGFKGSPQDLLNPFVNLTYAVPYLANAFVIAGKQEDAAVRLYAAGYYYTARSRGLLGALRTAESRPLSGEQDANLQLASAQTPEAGEPLQPSAAPIPQQVAAAPLPEHRPATMPEGKKTGDSVAMVVDKKGDAAPPKKWTHDGGVSVVARGEQPVEQIAAFGQAPGIEAKGAPVIKHGHAKTTLFAAIYLPPAAQAYAASPEGRDPQLAQAPAQAAIAQMSSGSAETPLVAGQPAETPSRTKKRHALASRKDSGTDGAATSQVARSETTEEDAPKSRNKRHAAQGHAVVAQHSDDGKSPTSQ